MERYQKICKENREPVEFVDQNPFVIVLVDVKRIQFQHDLLQGRHGGYEAARRLEEGVKNYLAGTPLGQRSVPVLVQIFADSDNLAGTFHSAPATESDTYMHMFCKQLTTGILYSGISGAWQEKSSANFRSLKDMLDHYYRIVQCEKIFIAGFHQNDHSTNLQFYGADQDAGKKIVLIETAPADSAQQRLQLPATQFDAVFCYKTSRHDDYPVSAILSTPKNTQPSIRPTE
ncbi:uncharacterized protein N7473_011105 [Penicillium subrubescens]|uniref:uncharacterized protein n=1 Tax=Penicillium subrubescens TaxID=1316194 RepID=UPI0025453F43|nr:uncharacterized protein N7473_011105 [Penicillium subrubescens]KAJ5882843.1 hypothetical protein N7473_011105 [Penicillium subrubescens]